MNSKLFCKIDKAVFNTARIIFFILWCFYMNQYNMCKYIEHNSIDTFCLKV